MRGWLRPRLGSVGDQLVTHFRVMPFDLDLYGHMNNAKYLNYLEAARWELQIRSGFLRLALKRGWIGPLAALEIEYYRPLKFFQKFRVTTQFVAFEERRFYVIQRFFSGSKEMARALVRGTVRQGRENIPPHEYLEPLGLSAEDARIEADLSEWFTQRRGDRR